MKRRVTIQVLRHYFIRPRRQSAENNTERAPKNATGTGTRSTTESETDSTTELTQAMKKISQAAKKISQQQATMIDLLRLIDGRLEDQDPSRKPIIRASESSSSAWNPLLDCTLENIIKPDIDRWRGTLDTLLVFVALFSAVVTSFLVQASAGLSQNPVDRTNELVANLTNIIIQLSDRASASSLSLSQPAPFEPDRNTVRLNVYWSLSLVVSLCVASLAVVGRGYIASLTRYRRHHTQAHEKLVEIYQRWDCSGTILRPMIEALPQMLVLAVIPFVVGLVDSLLSSAVALTPQSDTSILGAGITASVFVGFTGVTIIFTIIHGCVYPSSSPFQSLLSPFFERRQQRREAEQPELNPQSDGIMLSAGSDSDMTSAGSDSDMNSRSRLSISMTDTVREYLKQCLNYVREKFRGIRDSYRTDAPADREKALSPLDLEIYHTTLLLTHNDDSVDHAVAALGSVISRMRDRGNSTGKDFEEQIVNTLLYLLSPECSRRAGIEVASVITNIYDGVQQPKFSDTNVKRLNTALYHALERDHVMAVGGTSWKPFMNSAYLNALLDLIPGSSPNHSSVPDYIRVLFVTKLAECSEESLDHIKIQATRCLYHVLYEDSGHSVTSVQVLDEILGSSLENLILTRGAGMAAMAALIQFAIRSYGRAPSTTSLSGETPYDALVSLFCWLSRNGSRDFIAVALEKERIRTLVEEHSHYVLSGLLQAVMQFSPSDADVVYISQDYRDIYQAMTYLVDVAISRSVNDRCIIYHERDIVEVLESIPEDVYKKWPPEYHSQCITLCQRLAADAPSAAYIHYCYTSGPSTDIEAEDNARIRILDAFGSILGKSLNKDIVMKPENVENPKPSQYRILD